MSTLDQLKQYTVIVADTGDIDDIKRLGPQDATTNPSLLLKSAFLPKYGEITDKALLQAEKMAGSQKERLQLWSEAIAVGFGIEILQSIPGRISTEVDARYSFDTEKTILTARRLIQLYQDAGIERDRVLIKIASTWEGIEAAKVLELEGIQCNLTLLFCLEQAVAAAEAKVFLISPFVGRILDWYKSSYPERASNNEFDGESDPGVQSVKAIYEYFRSFDYATVVMGASFRNRQQVESLAGCDRLTISPQILDELQSSDHDLPRVLSPDALSGNVNRIVVDEKRFRWGVNQNPMATDKLADGIRRFAADQVTFENKLLELNKLK